MNESTIRRRLAKVGLALRKDRGRTPGAIGHRGGYRIVEPNRSMIVAGERYDLTLDEAAYIAAAHADE